MKSLTIILALATGLVACNQSYKFDQASIPDPTKTELPSVTPPPVVDEPECSADYQQWISDGSVSVQCPQVCSDGTPLQCTAQVEKELVCHDGSIQESGVKRYASVSDPQNSCPPPPDLTKSVAEIYDVPAVTGKADVLIILDTSGSMSTTLTKLAQRMSSLTSKWGKIDWQMGITNSGLGSGLFKSSAMNGKLMTLKKTPFLQDSLKRTILTRTTSSAATYFEQSLTWPKNMASDSYSAFCALPPFCMSIFVKPQPMATIITALSEPTTAPLFRTGSYFIPIVISDVDENERGSNATSAQEAIKAFKTSMGSKMKDMVGFSVIIPPGDDVCLKKHRFFSGGNEGTNGKFGVTAANFAKLTGGDVLNLCDDDYTANLSKISDRVREKIETITIQQVPIAGTLQVSFVPAANIGWKLVGNKIVFNNELPSGSRVNITYKVKK